jgi:hypothetical protein
MFRHEAWRRRVSLLVAGALADPERDETLRHLDACGRCREERAALAALLERVARDPLRGAEPKLSAAALATRVHAALDSAARAPGRPRFARLLWPAAIAAATVALLVSPWLRPRSGLVVPATGPSEAIAMPDEMLDRLERNLARQRAARYLSEAQAVLVNVATPPDCERAEKGVDVEQEARRSRELLARRALLVELDGESVMSARLVLEDVDTMLREVAALPGCARPRDLEPIHSELARRRLLMKIDLMTRELVG